MDDDFKQTAYLSSEKRKLRRDPPSSNAVAF